MKQSPQNNNQNTEVVGKTLWDVISKIFTGRPLVVISTLVGVLILFLILTISGILKFEINNGSLSMGFKSRSQATNSTNYDDITNFCINTGIELKKKYVIKSLTYFVNYVVMGKKRDSIMVNERIVYDIIALQDISKADNVFREEYTGDNNSLGRWYGNNNENQFMAGNEQTYYVHFDCKKGESHTLITGKDSYSNSAAYLEDFSAYYPNEEDVVGNLTIIVSTKDYKLKTNSNSAVRVTVKNGVKVNEEKDSFYNSNDESDSYNNTVSHTWNRVLPDEQFNLYVYGKIR